MIEDYISKEAIGQSKWKSPISSKHNKAILATFVLALVLSIATNKNFYTQSTDQDLSIDSDSSLIADNDNDNQIDDSVPLAQAYSNASNSKKALENYDDSLNDVDLADSDAQLDKEVSELAQTVDKDNEAEAVGAKWVTENVQKGDSISSLFNDLNIPASTLMAILDNKAVAKNVHSLRIGDKLSFLVDAKGELVVFIKQISDSEQLRFYKTTKDGQFAYTKEKVNTFGSDDADADAALIAKSLQKEKPKSDNKTSDTTVVAKADDKKKEAQKETLVAKNEPAQKAKKAVRGRLVLVTINKGESFSSAAIRSGLTYSEINRILQMFKGKVQFSRNVRVGDTMRVLFSQNGNGGKIQAVEFSLKRSGKVSSFLNKSDGKYYDERGLNAQRSTFSRIPFRSAVRVTSPFNPHRRHPITGVTRPHNGVDFGLPVGTPVVAPAEGIVDKAQFSRGAGYYVVVRHSGGLSTVYMHLSKISVKVGQRVKAGHQIARSGNTGMSTGPHLHYEIRVNGRAVNPLRINLDNRGVEINAKARKAFAASIKQYKRELYQNSLLTKSN